jgi:hypothetical protein
MSEDTFISTRYLREKDGDSFTFSVYTVSNSTTILVGLTLHVTEQSKPVIGCSFLFYSSRY